MPEYLTAALIAIFLGAAFFYATDVERRLEERGEWHPVAKWRPVRSISGELIAGTVMKRKLPDGTVEYRERTDEEIGDQW